MPSYKLAKKQNKTVQAKQKKQNKNPTANIKANLLSFFRLENCFVSLVPPTSPTLNPSAAVYMKEHLTK